MSWGKQWSGKRHYRVEPRPSLPLFAQRFRIFWRTDPMLDGSSDRFPSDASIIVCSGHQTRPRPVVAAPLERLPAVGSALSPRSSRCLRQQNAVLLTVNDNFIQFFFELLVCRRLDSTYQHRPSKARDAFGIVQSAYLSCFVRVLLTVKAREANDQLRVLARGRHDDECIAIHVGQCRGVCLECTCHDMLLRRRHTHLGDDVEASFWCRG